MLAEEFRSPEAALPALDAYQARHPEDPDVAFVRGRILYARGDEGVLTEMQKALERPSLVIDACRYAYAFLAERGREGEAGFWRERAQAQAEIDAAARAERSQLAPGDPLEPLELSEEQRQYLVDRLRASGKVKKAWVARKQLAHHPEVPALAFAIVARGLRVSDDALVERVVESLDLDCALFVVQRGGQHRKLAKRIIEVGERLL